MEDFGGERGTGSSGDCCPVNSGVRVLEAELTG